MKNFDSHRNLIKLNITGKLSSIPDICSITFVGSFEHKEDLSAISDIDIIVIVNHLSEALFMQIEKTAQSFSGEDCGLPEYNVRLNMSFGPLKFNDDKTIVFHIMVYDLEGHKKHVNESPFTCFDWEYYQASFGKNLSDIYPVNALQLTDIIGTRRGLESYLSDLQKGVITFRKYSFLNGTISEVKEFYPMDDRHKKEYAYHVMKFLMLNLIKIFHQKNERYSHIELSTLFEELDPAFPVHTQFFLELSEWKYNSKTEPENIFNRLDSFIQTLNKWLLQLEKALPYVVFYRHAKTELNDGSFLGIGRNPGILPPDKDQIPQNHFDHIITSDMLRAILTGNLLTGNEFSRNSLLNEIDYGLVEGLKFDEINKSFPSIIEAWSKKEDPAFPEGESQTDVALRLDRFIKNELLNFTEKRTAVVTHNVVIRALLGKIYALPVHKWYTLQLAHLEPVRLRIFNNTLIPELDIEQRIRLRNNQVAL